MQTDHLREFVDLCDTLNFTKSARRLNIAQSTLSRHIRALEGEIGTRLFDRSADRVRLTRAGHTLYNEARPIIKSLEEMRANTRRNAQDGVVSLKVSGSTIQPTLNRFLSRMQATAAARDLPVRFEYTHVRPISAEQPPCEAIELLDSGTADLLIEFFPPDSEALETHGHLKLCAEPLFVFARNANPLVSRQDLKLDDLSGMPFLLCSMYQHCTTLYEDALRRGGCTPSSIRTAIVDDLLVIPETLAHLASDEITVFQANFAATYGFGDDGTDAIAKLDVHDSRAALTFYLMWRPDDNRPEIETARTLARDVKASFAQRPSPETYQFAPAAWDI